MQKRMFAFAGFQDPADLVKMFQKTISFPYKITDIERFESTYANIHMYPNNGEYGMCFVLKDGSEVFIASIHPNYTLMGGKIYDLETEKEINSPSGAWLDWSSDQTRRINHLCYDSVNDIFAAYTSTSSIVFFIIKKTPDEYFKRRIEITKKISFGKGGFVSNIFFDDGVLYTENINATRELWQCDFEEGTFQKILDLPASDVASLDRLSVRDQITDSIPIGSIARIVSGGAWLHDGYIYSSYYGYLHDDEIYEHKSIYLLLKTRLSDGECVSLKEFDPGNVYFAAFYSHRHQYQVGEIAMVTGSGCVDMFDLEKAQVTRVPVDLPLAPNKQDMLFYDTTRNLLYAHKDHTNGIKLTPIEIEESS
jgi:hypothetical protein